MYVMSIQFMQVPNGFWNDKVSNIGVWLFKKKLKLLFYGTKKDNINEHPFED